MNRFRILPVDRSLLKLGRAGVVFLSLFAWFAISNHCALATLVRPNPAAHSTCHGDNGSGPAKQSPDQTPCCKVLRATVANAAKVMPSPTFAAPPSFAVQSVETRILEKDRHDLFADTGPPRQSFAELVLQRSLLAHAPPFLA